MARKRLVGLGVLGTLIAIAISVYAFRPREASLDGKPVSKLFKEYVALKDDLTKSPPTERKLEQMEEYRNAFRTLGSNSVGYLEKVIDNRSGSMVVRLYRIFLTFLPSLETLFPKPTSTLQQQLQAAELLLMLSQDPSSQLSPLRPKSEQSKSIFNVLQFLYTDKTATNADGKVSASSAATTKTNTAVPAK